MERIDWAIARAGKQSDLWSSDWSPLRLKADALFRKSETSTPPWNVDAAHEAIQDYERLPGEEKMRVQTSGDPRDLPASAAMACLHLRVFRNVGEALRASAPLRDPDNLTLLSPASLEILGAVYNANKQPKDAVHVLTRAIKSPTGELASPSVVPVGCWIELGLAYIQLKKPLEAETALSAVRRRYPGRSSASRPICSPPNSFSRNCLNKTEFGVR